MTKLNLIALVEHEKTGFHRCPVASRIAINLGDEKIAELKSPVGGSYNTEQALKLFKDDFKQSKGKLSRFKYTFRGNTLRGMVKLLI